MFEGRMEAGERIKEKRAGRVENTHKGRHERETKGGRLETVEGRRKKGEGRREQGEGRREKEEGRREKEEWRQEKG